MVHGKIIGRLPNGGASSSIGSPALCAPLFAQKCKDKLVQLFIQREAQMHGASLTISTKAVVQQQEAHSLLFIRVLEQKLGLMDYSSLVLTKKEHITERGHYP